MGGGWVGGGGGECACGVRVVCVWCACFLFSFFLNPFSNGPAAVPAAGGALMAADAAQLAMLVLCPIAQGA